MDSVDSVDSEIDERVSKLLKLPQYEQRTPEWYAQRLGALTASDVPTALGDNKYKSQWQLLLDKCGAGKPFTGNAATVWGNHYEDVAIEKYSEIKNKKVLSFGLIIHPEHKWLGGSPDGITTDGILLEVKCPLTRKIVPGEVPHHYLAQVLINLEVCNLEIAHFIEFVPGKSDSDYQINIVTVHRDREWFAEKLSILKEFWDSVLMYREIGISKHPKFQKYSDNSENRKYKNSGVVLDLTSNDDSENGNQNIQNIQNTKNIQNYFLEDF